MENQYKKYVVLHVGIGVFVGWEIVVLAKLQNAVPSTMTMPAFWKRKRLLQVKWKKWKKGCLKKQQWRNPKTELKKTRKQIRKKKCIKHPHHPDIHHPRCITTIGIVLRAIFSTMKRNTPTLVHVRNAASVDPKKKLN